MDFRKMDLADWAYFVAAVFIAGIAINSVARRFPQLQQIAAGV